MIIAQRIIRSKGSTVAVRKGKLYLFNDVDTLRQTAMKRRHVFSFITDDNGEGTCRSGRIMRKVDSIVRNVVSSGIQR